MEEQKETTVLQEKEGAELGKMGKCGEKMAKCKMMIMNHKREALIFFGIVFLIVAVSVGGYLYQQGKEQKRMNSVKSDTEQFIKENLIAPGVDFKVSEFKEENGVYKMSILVGKQNIDAYLTKDGKKLFPQVIDLEKEAGKEKAPVGPEPVKEVTQKTDVPVVELFVMSYCPYGTQMEKGMLPVAKALGSKIKFDVKFVSYVMHEKKEFNENINQYCIQKEEPSKFLGYLECFNKSSDSAQCMISSKVNKSKITACVSATDKQFGLTEEFNQKGQNQSFPSFGIHKELNEKYGVQGSPSLIINGQLVDSARDSASILKTVCSGFITAPKECETVLSSEIPTPGFGDGTTPATGNASCQ